MKRKKAFKGILIDVALLLVCLVCITTCISSGILAKFTTGTKENDNAKVAKFSVSAVKNTGIDDKEITDDDNSAVYEITIKNDSETAVSYDIVLNFNMNVAGIVKVYYNNGTQAFASDASVDDGKTIKIENAGQLANNRSDTKTFRIEIDLDAFTQSVQSGEANINFDTIVSFTQID